MLENRGWQLCAYAVALVVIAALGSRWSAASGGVGDAPAVSAPLRVQEERGGRLTVHVAGAVRRPGVYRLPAGARVDDAVRRAGGPARTADLTQVNLAAELEDGRQVLLPARAVGGAEAAQAGAPAAPTATAPGVLLNLNTATLEQLDGLDGIGPATARRILDYRQANDGFSTVEQLGEVAGIGDKRLATLREQVRV